MDAVSYITGNVGTEVESRGNGAVATFRLACSPRVKAKGEWVDGATTWIEVACFRALAEHVRGSIRKGDPVVVVGKLRTSVWEKDGQTHEKLQIEADIIGHDLNRGTTIFRRPTRVLAADPSDQEPPPDEIEDSGPSSEERKARAA